VAIKAAAFELIIKRIVAVLAVAVKEEDMV